MEKSRKSKFIKNSVIEEITDNFLTLLDSNQETLPKINSTLSNEFISKIITKKKTSATTFGRAKIAFQYGGKTINEKGIEDHSLINKTKLIHEHIFTGAAYTERRYVYDKIKQKTSMVW